MCCVLEIGLMIFGIIALITGKLKLSRNKVVQGSNARLLGVVGIIPLPLALMVSLVIGVTGAANGNPPSQPQTMFIATIAEAAIVLTAAAIVFGVGFAIGKPEQPPNFQYPYGGPGNAPYAPPSNNPYQAPYQPPQQGGQQPPQQGGTFDPFRQ